MRMFKICTLCRISFTRQPVCSDCWQTLQIQPHTIQKHDITIYAAGIYQHPLDAIIHQFKYKQALYYIPLFQKILSNIALPKFQAVVPMPISNQKLKQRGYNQAQLLAKIIAKKYNIPLWFPIQRTAEHSQKGLDRIERLSAIQQQFIPHTSNKIRYRKVLIVDDVLTTGASIDAVKLQLEQLGCKEISALCLAIVK